MSVDDFRNYWLNEHAAIIRAIPELRKYVASITLPSAYRNREPLYDGISEAWFDDEDAIRASADSPPRRAASADDAKFVDMSKAASIITDEIIQKEGTPGDGAVKMFSLLTRKPGTDVAAFQAYWRTTSWAAGRENPASAALRAMPRAAVGIRGRTRAALRRCRRAVVRRFSKRCGILATPTSTREVKIDEPKFLTLPFPFIIASEHRIV